jgi:hypothetical protein
VADLKLGPLPKQSTVKVTVVLSDLLKGELDAYAARAQQALRRTRRDRSTDTAHTGGLPSC